MVIARFDKACMSEDMSFEVWSDWRERWEFDIFSRVVSMLSLAVFAIFCSRSFGGIGGKVRVLVFSLV